MKSIAVLIPAIARVRFLFKGQMEAFYLMSSPGSSACAAGVGFL